MTPLLAPLAMSTTGWLSFAGIVVGVLGTYGGVRLTTAESRRARKVEVETQKDTRELEEWRKIASEYRTRLELVEERVDGQDARLQATRHELREEQDKREQLSRELESAREHLASIERRFRSAVTYIRSLLDLLIQHNIEPPEPPVGIDIPAHAGRTERF